MAGLLWLVWADLGLPLDPLPSLGVEKIRTWVVDRSHGHVLRAAGHTADKLSRPFCIGLDSSLRRSSGVARCGSPGTMRKA
jgi:hypothetical protein